jgi:hypothetical protein
MAGVIGRLNAIDNMFLSTVCGLFNKWHVSIASEKVSGVACTMEDSAQLLWGVVFGSIGIGYFLYGKKRKATVPLLSGIVLMVYPYFITNNIALVCIGVVFTLLPAFVRL